MEFRPVEEEITIPRRKNRRHRIAWLGVLDQSVDGLALVRSKRTNINEPRDLRVIARLGDHGSAVGMADQNHGTILRGDDPFRSRDVTRKREGWILDDRNGVAGFLQGFVDALPAGSVDEASVNENDVLDVGGCARLRQENLAESEH